MEEILASIRRIIADDEANKPAAKPEPAPAPAVAAPPPAPPPPRPAPPPPVAVVKPEPVPAPPPPPPAPAPADVLDLTEAMTAMPPPVSPSPAPNFRTIDGESDVVFTDRPHDPPPEPAVRVVEEARKQFTQTSAPDRSLLSNNTMAAVDSAFNSLAHTILGNNARTLEDLVKEMLRPMLKAWLDDNLPSLVDRIVRAEIERVSRGR
jgi:cell pole-organizing protein PopZ